MIEQSPTGAAEDGDVLFQRRGGLGLITLNRPKALNTINLAMYRTLQSQIDAWAHDPHLHVIAIRGAGGKAFCAGGDIRVLWESGAGIADEGDVKRVLFAEEYRLLRQIHRLAKPWLALLNGIVMGGGAGMSVNGSHRIATDTTLFAMPETAIGLIPDIGATRFLGLCPGLTGLYVGLTGARLKAPDLLMLGLATHYVPEEGLTALLAALETANWRAGGQHRQLESLLSAFAVDPGPAPLLTVGAAIERCFGVDSIEEVLARLKREGSDWAAQTIAALDQASPTSLKLAFRQLQARDLPIEAALKLEFSMVQRLMALPDFFEGVRARLVDKDQSPRWRPPALCEVADTEIDRIMAPMTSGGLTFASADGPAVAF